MFSRPDGGSDIQMQLERKMARVIIRISGFGSQYYDDQKTASNVSIYSEASGIADGNPTGSSTKIQPYAQGNGGQGSTYTALVVPGYGDSGARFIQLSDGEGSTLLMKGIPELEAGNSYTFNLMVGKNRIEVASVTVQDWTTGETLAGGQATEGSAAPEYYNKLTKINDDFDDQRNLLRELGRGYKAYNSSLTAAQAYALATYQAAIDGKPVYVIMSLQGGGYEIHYALSTDAAATEHTDDLYRICDPSNPVRMYYVAQ